MSNRIYRIAAVVALAATGIAQTYAVTLTPVRQSPLPAPSPSLPVLKVCFTKVFVSPTESRTFARACTATEAPGTVRLGG